MKRFAGPMILVLLALALVGCGSNATPPSVVSVAKQEAEAAYGHALADARRNDRRGVNYWLARAHSFIALAKDAATTTHESSVLASVASWSGKILGALGGVAELLATVAAAAG